MTTYYVSNTGHDTNNNGLSEGAPWLTIAKVNASTFSAGDSILFKRGDTWREQLTVPSSGGAGSPITFGAYGSGEKPIFNGSNLVTTWSSDAVESGGVFVSGFETETSLFTTEWTGKTTNGTNSAVVQTTTKAHGTSAAQFTFDGTNKLSYAYKTITGQSDAYIRLYFMLPEDPGTGAWGTHYFLGLKSGATALYSLGFEYMGAAWQLVGFRDAPSANAYEGGTFALNTWHYIELRYVKHASTGGYVLKLNGTQLVSALNLDTSTWPLDRIEVGGVASRQGLAAISAGKGLLIDSVKIDTSAVGAYPSGVANAWNSTVTTEPKIVAINGTVATVAANKASVNATNKWFWGSNQLTVYATSDPTTAYTSPGVEATARNQAIHTNEKSYLIFDNLVTKYTNGTQIYGGPTGQVVGFSSVDGSYANGNIFGLVLTGTNTLTSCTASHTYAHGEGYDLEEGTYNATGCLADDTDGVGFSSHTTAVVNEIGCKASNGKVFDGHGFAAHDSSTHNLSYCIATGNALSGIATVGTSHGNIYNSVFYGNNTGDSTVHSGIVIASTGNWNIKNNICSNNVREIIIDAGASGTLNIDYNDSYSASTLWQWKGSDKSTLANWKTASGATHDLNTDPLFVSPSTGDFHLQTTSPLINAGVVIPTKPIDYPFTVTTMADPS